MGVEVGTGDRVIIGVEDRVDVGVTAGAKAMVAMVGAAKIANTAIPIAQPSAIPRTIAVKNCRGEWFVRFTSSDYNTGARNRKKMARSTNNCRKDHPSLALAKDSSASARVAAICNTRSNPAIRKISNTRGLSWHSRNAPPR